MKTRIGFGFDVHKLVEGRELWLGGIRIVALLKISLRLFRVEALGFSDNLNVHS